MRVKPAVNLLYSSTLTALNTFFSHCFLHDLESCSKHLIILNSISRPNSFELVLTAES